MRIFRLRELEVTLSELVRCHFQGRPLNLHTLDRYRTALSEGNQLLNPMAGVVLLADEILREFVSLVEKSLPPTYQNLLPLFESSRSAYVVFCTIGPYLEEEIQESCLRDEVARGFILDAVGSLGVAKYSRYVEGRLAREAAAQGLTMGVPIMPGTRDIALELNQLLSEFVNVEAMGMRLTEHSIMVPSKSLSMILGVGTNVNPGTAGHDCEWCQKESTCFLKELWKMMGKAPPEETLDQRFQIMDYYT